METKHHRNGRPRKVLTFSTRITARSYFRNSTLPNTNISGSLIRCMHEQEIRAVGTGTIVESLEYYEQPGHRSNVRGFFRRSQYSARADDDGRFALVREQW